MRWLWLVILLVGASASAKHPPMGARKPTSASPILAKALNELELYKAGLDGKDLLSCCVKPLKGSKTPGCRMCAAKNGSCNCAANLAKGKGVCGECKGEWMEGHGLFSLKALGYKSPAEIPILTSLQQAMNGVAQDASDTHLAKYREYMIAAKRTMVGEGRFNCCVGDGGCDECALEGSCSCAEQLSRDVQTPRDKRKGICAQCLDGQYAGKGRVDGLKPDEMALMPMAMADGMPGAITESMSQEAGGTSWLPSATQPHMIDLPSAGRFRIGLMGLATANFADAGGWRGETQFFGNSMAMLMATKPGLQLRVAGSLDAITNGKRGYPNLFQTGETAGGQPLKDRQHPHDLLMELSATVSRRIGGNTTAFVYLAPIGEPALGTSAFQHRASGSENPEAPIGHHWNDGTHITYGVLTAGVAVGDRWKLDGSWFNGREPNENRFDFDPVRLDSYSGRVTFNPTSHWSFSASYGYLRGPEALEPGLNQHRFVAAAFYERGAWSVGLIFGRNAKAGRNSDAWDLEAAFRQGFGTWFGRWESVDKDELVDVPQGVYKVQKWTLGYVRDFQRYGEFKVGIGGFLGISAFPNSLEPIYGRNPLSVGVFLRMH